MDLGRDCDAKYGHLGRKWLALGWEFGSAAKRGPDGYPDGFFLRPSNPHPPCGVGMRYLDPALLDILFG